MTGKFNIAAPDAPEILIANPPFTIDGKAVELTRLKSAIALSTQELGLLVVHLRLQTHPQQEGHWDIILFCEQMRPYLEQPSRIAREAAWSFAHRVANWIAYEVARENLAIYIDASAVYSWELDLNTCQFRPDAFMILDLVGQQFNRLDMHLPEPKPAPVAPADLKPLP